MTNIISFQKPGITRITAAFFAAFALCDIGSIHPADIFSVLIFAGMLLLFSPTLTQRLTNIGAASSVLPRHFYPICRLLAVLYTLFYAAAKHAELSGSFDSRIFRLAFLAAAVIGLYFIFFRFCELSMLFLASRQHRRLPKTLCNSLTVHVLYPQPYLQRMPCPANRSCSVTSVCSSAGCSGFCTSFPVF